MGFDAEVSSTVAQNAEDSIPSQMTEHHLSSSTGSSSGTYNSVMGSPSHTTSTGSPLPARSQAPLVAHNSSGVLLAPVGGPLNHQSTTIIMTSSATSTPSMGSYHQPQPAINSNNLMAMDVTPSPSVMINSTAPIVPTLGRPPSVKQIQPPVATGGLDSLAPGGVLMNARAPGSTMSLNRMKGAGGGLVIPGGVQSAMRMSSGRGRGQAGSKPPPGAVNLERSYQICQAVIQNSPNRHQLRCQLRPPSGGGGTQSVGGKEMPTTDTQNSAVTSSNRLVRLGGGGGGKQMPPVQRQSSPVMMRPVIMAGTVVNGGMVAKPAATGDPSLIVPRASSAPPPVQQPTQQTVRKTNGEKNKNFPIRLLRFKDSA